MSYLDLIRQSGLQDVRSKCFQRLASGSCGQREPEHPRSFVRGTGQYLHSPANISYLDCIGSVAHVGHSHPKVIAATIRQFATKVSQFNAHTESLDMQYPHALLQTLPDSFDSVLFCSSGSEAVDLALQLSRLYTGGKDVICMEGSFHGGTESTRHISTRISQNKREEWAKVLPIPNSLPSGGPSDELVLEKLKNILQSTQDNGGKISCFIAEPFLTLMGCLIPPTSWMQEVYRLVHEANGLCVADEVQSGLCRIGSHYWSFEASQLNPDIVIIGKSIGNGYPMAAVATRREISDLLGDRLRSYVCPPVMNATGLAVLEIIREEKLMENAFSIGRVLMDLLRSLKMEHKTIGYIRGSGLLIAIEIVCRVAGFPSKSIAQEVVSRMRQHCVLVASEGLHGNVLLLVPPLCFSEKDATFFHERLHKVLLELEAKLDSVEPASDHDSVLEAKNELLTPEGRIGILQEPLEEKSSGSKHPSLLNRSCNYFDPD